MFSEVVYVVADDVEVLDSFVHVHLFVCLKVMLAILMNPADADKSSATSWLSCSPERPGSRFYQESARAKNKNGISFTTCVETSLLLPQTSGSSLRMLT